MVSTNVVPRVIDLSHYENVQDKFAGAKAFGIWGVINKVTEGRGVQDHSFGWRRGPARDMGLLYGGYHYMSPGDIEEQVSWFLTNIGTDISDLLLALDHEDPKVPLSDVQKWLQLVHDKVGRWPKLYSGFLIKQQLGTKTDPFWKNIDLWLSQYGPKPVCPKQWPTQWLWQYTGDGVGPLPHNVPGITCAKGLDINHYSGSLEKLKAEWVK